MLLDSLIRDLPFHMQALLELLSLLLGSSRKEGARREAVD